MTYQASTPVAPIGAAGSTGGVAHILPRVVRGFPVEISQSELGGLQVIVWRSDARDDGFCFHASDLRHARELLRAIERGDLSGPEGAA